MMNVPTLILNNGIEIPCIGNGPGIIGYTPHPAERNLIEKIYNKFISRKLQKRAYINAVAHSFKIGFTLLDNSAAYSNATAIRAAIAKSGISREKLFITTRISNRAQFNRGVREEFFKQLEDTGIDHFDLLQFHWPVTDYYVDTWKEMIKLQREGYVRCLGVANCHQHHLETLIDLTGVAPTINQFEVHPLFTQKSLIEYCKSKKIQVEAYTPIARFDDRLMKLPLLKNIAKKYGKTIVQIILRWDIQNGIIPLIRSLNPKRQLENISIFDFELTEEEMRTIDSININARIRYDPDNCDFTIL